ncbi:MAG: DNA polymerase III subunit beta [Candidatus Shapirobacteria bacterium]
MQLSLLQENLKTALDHVSRFVSLKSQLPILGNLLLTTSGGRLIISATNLEVGISYSLGAKIDREGSICLPAREITEFVSYLTPGKIDLELVDTRLVLTTPKTQSSFTTVSPSEFPSIPAPDPTSLFSLDYTLLSQAVSQVSFAAASDDSRPVLTSLLCQFQSDHLLFAATDGFRLSLSDHKLVNPLTLPANTESTFLIPAKTLTEVVKLSKAAQSIQLGLTPDRHQMVFILDDIQLVSRLIQGDYPDYQRIMPESFATRVFLNRDDLAQSVKIASVFASQSANVIRLILKSDHVEITANAPQVGQNKVSVDARVEGEPLEIAFNYKFVNDFLSVCKGQELSISLNEPLTPALFSDQSVPHFTHIIMPVRIQD